MVLSIFRLFFPFFNSIHWPLPYYFSELSIQFLHCTQSDVTSQHFYRASGPKKTHLYTTTTVQKVCFSNDSDRDCILTAVYCILKSLQAMLPANVDELTRILNRFGVAINGLSNNTVDRLKKTCFPKVPVTLTLYTDQLIKLNGQEKTTACAIYEKVKLICLFLVNLHQYTNRTTSDDAHAS